MDKSTIKTELTNLGNQFNDITNLYDQYVLSLIIGAVNEITQNDNLNLEFDTLIDNISKKLKLSNRDQKILKNRLLEQDKTYIDINITNISNQKISRLVNDIKNVLNFKENSFYAQENTNTLTNIIPNPLYKGVINYQYDNKNYATGDLNGYDNTSYLKKYNLNINNIINNEFYIPSIGELGIAFENYEVINNSISQLGEQYKNHILNDNLNIVSSTFYYSENISNEEYKQEKNLSNVWVFNNSKAEITYSPINRNYNILPFYKFTNNVIIDEDNQKYDIQNISYNIITSYNNGNIILNNLKYYETNPPIHNFGANKDDFNTQDWNNSYFSSKYFFTISFNEANQEISTVKSLKELHNQYLNHYESCCERSQYVDKDGDISNVSCFIPISYLVTDFYDYSMGQKNSTDFKFPIYNGQTKLTCIIPPEYDKIEFFRSNNGVSYIPNKEYQKYLIYNLPIYGNHIVFMPIYGSGENYKGVYKNNPETIFYVAIPNNLYNFNCTISNECDIYISLYLSNNEFNIYKVYIKFNTDHPTKNIIKFSCKNLKNKTISRQYYFTIYSLMISNICTNNNELNTYFNIENYYVVKEPYGFWHVNEWDKVNKEVFGKLYNSYYQVDQNNTNYVKYDDYLSHTRFNKLSSSKFNTNYDISMMTDFISTNFKSSYQTTLKRGLRVERMCDNDTIFKLSNHSNNKEYILSYTYNGENCPFVTNDNDNYKFIIYENIPRWHFNNVILTKTTNNIYYYDLSHDYSTLTFNTYYFLNNPTKNTINSIYNNRLSYFSENVGEQLSTFYKPILRIYRNIDQYGLYNDLIFSDVTNHINNINKNIVEKNITINNISYLNCSKYLLNLSRQNQNGFYTNRIKLNIPIIGAKQSLCLGMAINNPQTIFKDIKNYYYLFSDYLLIYNSTNSELEIFIDDPSLSVVSNQQSIFKIKPKELKIYYPSNYIYIENNYKLNNIYSIYLSNCSNEENVNFDLYKIGETNLSIEQLQHYKYYVEDQLGYKIISSLINEYYTNRRTTDTNTDEEIYKDFNNMYKYINQTIKIFEKENNIDIVNKLINNTDNHQIFMIISNLMNNQNKIFIQGNNEINIPIQDYSLNKAGNIIIIKKTK